MIPQELLKDIEIKKLLEDERTARLENEFSKSNVLCTQLVKTLYDRGDFPNFLIIIEYLNQRNNQSREAICSMIKYCLNEVLPALPEDKQTALLTVVIKVTEGKIFVEREYSIAIRKMTDIHIKNGNTAEAAKLIQDVQIEAFGSLERSYKVDYILFQMKVLLDKGDYIRNLIVSNKINRQHLNDPGFEKLKIRFYELMIIYYLHEEKYIEVSKCYKEMYDFVKMIRTKLEHPDEVKSECLENYIEVSAKNNPDVLFENYVMYLAVCPPELETKNMFHELQLKYKPDLDANVNTRFIVDKRLSDDIIVIDNTLFKQFDNVELFKHNNKIYSLFRKFWIQHDLLVFEKFFSKVHLGRIAEMTNVNVDEVEKEIADMVVCGHIYAKINRIESICVFKKKSDHRDILNELNYDLNKMLKGIENTCHLINKEYLKYGIK
jgi:26S proteasome regulatory subunit N5